MCTELNTRYWRLVDSIPPLIKGLETVIEIDFSARLPLKDNVHLGEQSITSPTWCVDWLLGRR